MEKRRTKMGFHQVVLTQPTLDPNVNITWDQDHDQGQVCRKITLNIFLNLKISDELSICPIKGALGRCVGWIGNSEICKGLEFLKVISCCILF